MKIKRGYLLLALFLYFSFLKTATPDHKKQIPADGKNKNASKKEKEKKNDTEKEKITVWLRVGEVVPGGVEVVIQPFQRLQDIANAYGISQKEIIEANGGISANMIKAGQKILIPGAKTVKAVKTFVPSSKIGELGIGGGVHEQEEEKLSRSLAETKQPSGVISGKLIKGGVLHTVLPGQTMWDISKAYNVSRESIVKANRLKSPDNLKIGSKILIPSAREVVPVPCSGGNTMYLMPIKFQRIHTGETEQLTLFNPFGKIIQSSYKIFQRLMFDHRTNKEHKIHPRLVALIVKVAAHFGFKPVIIYSGFRAYNPKQYTKGSKHNAGRAIDFAIEGVSNKTVMSYCRTLGNVGVGYYPNSYFVHLDVREEPAFWVDYSGPGEKPRYGRLKKEKKKVMKVENVDVEADSDSYDVDIPHKGNH